MRRPDDIGRPPGNRFEGTEETDLNTEIVVVGSANLDLVVDVARVPSVGETVLGGDLRRVPGGKGANQAVASARLGRSVAMIGRLGDDEAGAMLRAAMADDGIDTTHTVSTSGVPTGVALIAVQADGDNSIVVSPGANARLGADDIERAERMLTEAAVTIVQLEIPIDAVVTAARVAAGIVILNPAPAPSGGLPEELFSYVDVLVPNQSELATLAGFEGLVDVARAVELARDLPCRAVVVTLGADGALVVDGDTIDHVAAPLVHPVDTTAAGDSFCGALADALVGGSDLVAAVSWAVRVGAATTLRAGAQTSLPTRHEVEELLA